ncbi:hypothetical protein SAMN05216389_106142 [Oceanobacillus limi]|uniref:Uncharacterized protein n=1 Tax=Oceanobacillus limi TaxID=930131 RepID=A0A1I0CDB3_9BACI|nr:hypothetical protein [Oceanobacillus limi]SET16915.1 hypothetical protein SAMN05216389_106142 [Oceanobacillus limi]
MGVHYETRHLFMAVAIAILFLSPVLLLLLPSFVANSLHNTDGSWFVFVPGGSYAVYGVGALFLIFAALLPFLLRIKKSSLLLAFICAILSVICFHIASQAYTSISDQSISYRYLFTSEEHQYSWDEIDRVVYNRIPKEEGFSDYEFYFSDGAKLQLKENGQLAELKSTIYKRLRKEEIRVEEVNH